MEIESESSENSSNQDWQPEIYELHESDFDSEELSDSVISIESDSESEPESETGSETSLDSNDGMEVDTDENVAQAEPAKLPPLSENLSPSKEKRKRSSPDEDDEDGATCTICLDQFHAGGNHKITSLKCGHIFGEACIRRWLNECAPPKCCPQCKTKAHTRDIRFIYAARIRVIDNSNELELERKLLELQGDKNRLMTENSIYNQMLIVQKAQIRKLTEEIDSLRNSMHVNQGRAIAGIRTIKTGKMYLEKNLDFRENLDSRMIKFLSRHKKFIVTQKSSEGSLFPGFGVKLIDFATYRQEKFINTSNKALNDVSVDSNESLVITASKDVVCKMFNLANSNSVHSFIPGTIPIWSCAFDANCHQKLYLGGQNGITYTYDTRNTSEVLKEVIAADNRSPVKFIIPMKQNEQFQLGGFFVVHMRSIYFYESSDTPGMLLNFNEPILYASYDDRTEMLLITKSPTGLNHEFKQTRHFLMSLVKEEGIPVLHEVFSFNGSFSALPSMTRPTQIKVPDGCVVTSYLQDTKMLQCWTPGAKLLHEIGVTDPINDICPIYLENSLFFGALSRSRCRLFKVNLGY